MQFPAIYFILAALVALAGCGDDAKPGKMAPDLLTGLPTGDVQAPRDVPADAATTPETSSPDIASPADVQTATDVAADTQTDTGPPVDDRPNAATCVVPSLIADYVSPLPPSPYAAWQAADSCLLGRHDVIIIFGCPSRDDGGFSTCQRERVRLAMLFYEARLAPRFIVTGGAVHTEHVEAEALAALLRERGIASQDIYLEPQAQHTDENLYYSTRIMEENGWTSAVVVSEDPGHLLMTGLCDSNCCVDLGRMTLRQFEVAQGLFVKAGHYVLNAFSTPNTPEECQHITNRLLCLTQSGRKACRANFQLTD